MVQIGSAVEMCSSCGDLAVCGEFWNLDPRIRFFWCAPCLARWLAGVRAAATRYPLPTVKRA